MTVGNWKPHRFESMTTFPKSCVRCGRGEEADWHTDQAQESVPVAVEAVRRRSPEERLIYTQGMGAGARMAIRVIRRLEPSLDHATLEQEILETLRLATIGSEEESSEASQA